MLGSLAVVFQPDGGWQNTLSTLIPASLGLKFSFPGPFWEREKKLHLSPIPKNSPESLLPDLASCMLWFCKRFHVGREYRLQKCKK
jgi:hypothetical protein